MSTKFSWITGLAVSGILLFAGAGGALAGDEKKTTADDQYRQTDTKQDPTKADSMKTDSMAMKDLKGLHTMDGEVTSIDKRSGKITIKTDGAGSLDLHFPPAALEGVNKGDRITVQLAMKNAGPAPTGSRPQQ
jgi:hypothetical protein